MQEHDLFGIFVGRLNGMGIRYMITGSVASIYYGEPRLTHDIDLVVELGMDDAEKFAKAFPYEEFYRPPREVIRIEAKRPYRGHFNLIHHETGFKADIYAAGEDKLHRWALSSRIPVNMNDIVFWLAPVEYVILRKLEFYREGGSEKHLRDVRSIIAFSPDRIDTELLLEKIREYSLEREWAIVTS